MGKFRGGSFGGWGWKESGEEFRKEGFIVYGVFFLRFGGCYLCFGIVVSYRGFSVNVRVRVRKNKFSG